MTSTCESIGNIISGLTEMKTRPSPFRTKGGTPRYGGMLTGGLNITPEIADSIAQLAAALLDQDPALKSRFTRKEWHDDTRNLVGPILMQIDLDLPLDENIQIVLAELQKELRELERLSRDCLVNCLLWVRSNPDEKTAAILMKSGG